MSEGSQDSKVTFCVQILQWKHVCPFGPSWSIFEGTPYGNVHSDLQNIEMFRLAQVHIRRSIAIKEMRHLVGSFWPQLWWWCWWKGGKRWEGWSVWWWWWERWGGRRWIPNDVSFSVWSTAVVFPHPCFSQLCCDNQLLFLLIIQDPFHLTMSTVPLIMGA